MNMEGIARLVNPAYRPIIGFGRSMELAHARTGRFAVRAGGRDDAPPFGRSRGSMQAQEFQLPFSAEAPAIARRIIEEHLVPLLPEERGDDVRLMTSELVSNAVRHAAPSYGDATIELLIDRDEDSVRVAVVDGGLHLDADGLTFEQHEDGHLGLYILDNHADGWGFSLSAPKASGSR